MPVTISIPSSDPQPSCPPTRDKGKQGARPAICQTATSLKLACHDRLLPNTHLGFSMKVQYHNDPK